MAFAYVRRIHVSQFLGCPLYFINREWYYMYMSKTKEFFGITIITMTRWWGPTTIRVSGDEEVSKELSKSRDGGIECSFPDRLIMIANHQVCLFSVLSNLFSHLIDGAWAGPILNLNVFRLDLYRLAIPLVGGIHQRATVSRTFVHHSEGIPQIHSCDWAWHGFFRLHFHVEEDGNRSAETVASSPEIEAGPPYPQRTEIQKPHVASHFS